MKIAIALCVIAVILCATSAITLPECRVIGRTAARLLIRTDYAAFDCRKNQAAAFMKAEFCTSQMLCADPVTAEMCEEIMTNKADYILSTMFCDVDTPSPSLGPSLGPSPTPGPSTECGLVKAVNFGESEMAGFELYDPALLVGEVRTFGPASSLDAVYSEHIWRDGDFRYRVTGLPIGSYRVVFHFAEIFGPNCEIGARVFGARIDSNDIIRDIDVFAAAGCRTPYTIESQITTAKVGTTLRIFKGAADNGMISAIEFYEC